MQVIVLLFVAVVSWAAAFYFRIVPPPVAAKPDGSAPAGSAASTATGSASAPLASSTASSTASSAAGTSSSAPVTASAAATATPVDPAGLAACVMSAFPDDTFNKGEPDFAFLCENTFPRRGVTFLQQQVVAGRGGGGGVSPGMRMWADMGWYQVAAYGLLRGRCCATAPELVWTFDLPCPMDEALAALQSAARGRDDAKLKTALEQFATNARCLSKVGLGVHFGQRGYPGPGVDTFRKMRERMAKADEK